jgi:hypothetical protein
VRREKSVVLQLVGYSFRYGPECVPKYMRQWASGLGSAREKRR